MIFTDRTVKASGPPNAQMMAIGMSPQKWELGNGIPFSGPSGKIFDEALAAHRIGRAQVRVTNLCNFFIDDNDLYSVPVEIMEQQRHRVMEEIDAVKPNVLLVMGADTLDLLTAERIYEKWNKKEQRSELATAGSKDGIVKWRGSIFQLKTTTGRLQKCVASMHPAAFIRGQWKWLLPYKYIDVRRAVTQSSFPEMKLSPREAIVAPSYQRAIDYLFEAQNKEYVSIDYEGRKHVTCLGLGWTGSEAMCIPLSRVGSPTYWSLEEEVTIWKLWCKLLQNPKVKKIAQNAAYEWIKSWLYGIHPSPLGMDTMHMHHCLYPDFGGVTDEWTAKKRDLDNPGHGLAFITSQYTDQPFYKDDGRHWRPELGQEAFWRYNALDCMVTFEAAMKMKGELERFDLWRSYEEGYLQQFEPSLRMEWFGVKQDIEKRNATRISLKSDLLYWGTQLKELTGYERVVAKAESKGKAPANVLNLRSTKQMKKFLYEERKYRARKNRKTDKITVDKDALNAIAAEHPEDKSLQLIIKMRDTQHFIDNVVNAKLDANDYIHCHNKLGGTNGTRWSTTESILESGTNLQNLPRQGPGRSFFLPAA